MITLFGDIPESVYYGIILSLIAFITSISIIIFYMKFMKRNIIYIKICKKMGSTYKVIKKIKINARNKNFKYGDKEFPVLGDEGILINNELNIFYDVDTSMALQIQKNKAVNITPELYKTIFEQRLNTLIFDDGSMFGNTMEIILIIGVVLSVAISIYAVIMIGDINEKLILIQNSLAKFQVIK